MKTAGLDIGTTSCKLTVFDENGSRIDQAYGDYPMNRKKDAHEIDMDGLLCAVWQVITEIAKKHPDIAAIGITSFGETFVLTDERGNPLYPSMLYTDPRGEEDCRRLCEQVGEREIAGITGLKPHPMFSISKIMWLKEHEPEIYARGTYLFQVGDYVIYHLTGKRAISYSLAARSMAFDIRRLTWSEEILEAAGVDRNMLSTPMPDGTDVGMVCSQAVKKTGLRPDCRIVSVSHDQVAAAVGAGAFDGSIAADGAGTVECLIVVYDSFPDPDILFEGGFPIVPHVIPGKYMTYVFNYTGGALLQWYIDNLAKKEKELATQEGCSAHAYMEAQFKKEQGPEPTGILVLPHFSGAGTPYMDIASKGAILGLTSATTTAELYRACMEGVTYEMRMGLLALENSGCCFRQIHATGGGSHSDAWVQMKADVLNTPVTTLATPDAGTVGSAMMTGVAIGRFADLEEAAERMVKKEKTFYPREEMQEKYMAVFERYQKMYDAVRPLM